MQLDARVPSGPISFERGDAAPRPPEPPRSLRASESRCARSPLPAAELSAEN